ncbi:site-specific DNA-methyltransferase [Filifactor alocis]|uniref:site-specific DNA-methyltransferase n=1 Tax=Filifactor alocis TaxID=143361 RepID=UPI0028EBC075|nr:site-specific DNA-methyltransferase [Filifactor alocis]
MFGGGYRKAVNFELLKQMLSDDILEGDEAYEFTWVGKKASIVEANKPIRKTLRPCKEKSVNWDTTENLYIEGDNLEVLKLLQESYLGKVKMIYIDPPYNTGNDFIYNDDFKMSKEEYADEQGEYDDDGNRMFKNTETNGRFHSDWCSMIYPRLMLARNLLSDDGVIFISIDYNENFNMRKILDEIFGDESFIGEIYWESKTKSQNTSTSYNKLQPKAEMIFVYSKQRKRRFNLIKKSEKEYTMIDDRGEYREHYLEVMNANGIRGRETMVFDISDGVSTVSLGEGKQWKLGQDQVAVYKDYGDLFIRDNKVIIKMRPEYERVDTTEPFWGFFSKNLGTAESAKKELKDILGPNGFETVKPVEIIKRLAYHSTGDDDIILDFFSGSSTTAHAVMQLNAEDGGNRKFIMIQLPEKTDEKSEAYKAGYENICEIGKERIRRAGQKILEDNKDKERIENLDIGFRVLKIDDTNMTDVYYSPAEYSQNLLSTMESNVKTDRTDLDLLFGCLLEWGLPLSLPYRSEQIEGCTVHNYNDGDLIACFDENIPDSVMKEIAKKQPLRAVFRDSSFANSPSKINVGELFKLLAPDTRVKVI